MILQVWPSLNIVYEPLRQIQRDVCIEWMSKYNLEEYLNDLRINSLIWLRNYFLRWPYLQKNGVWLGAFLTEVDFSKHYVLVIRIHVSWSIVFITKYLKSQDQEVCNNDQKIAGIAVTFNCRSDIIRKYRVGTYMISDIRCKKYIETAAFLDSSLVPRGHP